jgi:fermentation-respiration switch protein FrsA (DUF1100 family)
MYERMGVVSVRFGRRFWIIPLVILIVVVLGLFGSTLYFLNQMFVHRVEKLVTTPEQLGLPSETISLTSADGIPLKAWWMPVERPQPRGVVVVLHGMDGQDASTMLGHAQFLHDAGYAALALDMRAHGRSGGHRIGLAFEEPQDVAAALDWVASQPELTDVPVALLGVSMGGATALRTAAMRQDVDAVISVSAFASVNMMIHDAFVMMMDAPDPVIALFTPFTRLAFRVMYGAWPATASPLADIDKIPPRPILVAHGDADSQVSVENAYALADAADHQVELWIVKGADHFVYNGNAAGPADAFYRERILAFLYRHLTPS